MKNTSLSSDGFGGFISPGAPDCGDDANIYNKGWSSERVPHPSTSGINGRRHISSVSAFATPFYSSRALPSKWEDAERWICSPIVLYPEGVCKNSYNNSQSVDQRSPKSKSGPIVPPAPPQPSSSSTTGSYQYPQTSNLAAEAHPGSTRGLMVDSPFSTGVMEADRVFRENIGWGCDGPDHGWIDLIDESSSSRSREEVEMEMAISPVASRRDMATQMSSRESPLEREVLPLISAIEPHNGRHCMQEQVREVTIHNPAKLIKRVSMRELTEVEDAYRNSEPSVSAWGVSQPCMMSLSKFQGEEAKIEAWENLQRAKAEAAIRELEVKLEKKKSASMDKIMRKLQTAKLKAEEMRRSVAGNEGNQISGSKTLKMKHLGRRRAFIVNPFMSCFAPLAGCKASSAVLKVLKR